MACNTPTHHHPDPTHAKTLPHHARPCQPATPPQHDAQDPANPPRRLNTTHKTPPHHLNAARKAPAATDPHATPTRRATSHHMPSHHHTKTLPPPTRHVAPMWRATPRRPITTLTPSTPSALPPPYQ
ncbi:hypothetical protein EDB89DRAFT_2078573 [Lactarius sanguifluus]|nr:hypothetical protein EDB89DRAFT_2078573 [Lactarius sanguifluus]